MNKRQRLPGSTPTPRAARPKLAPSQIRVRATWSVDQRTRAAINAAAKLREFRNGGRMLDADYGGDTGAR